MKRLRAILAEPPTPRMWAIGMPTAVFVGWVVGTYWPF